MRTLNLLLLIFVLFGLATLLLLYQRSTAVVELSTQHKLRSERHSGDVKRLSPRNKSHSTGVKRITIGHIIRADNRQVSRAVSTGKFIDGFVFLCRWFHDYTKTNAPNEIDCAVLENATTEFLTLTEKKLEETILQKNPYVRIL